MNTLFPYPTLVGEIEVRVKQVRIDGKPLSLSVVSRPQRAVALHQVERPNWEDGSIDLEVTLPELELADGPWSEVACVAILTEGSTNTRVVRRLQRDRLSSTWSGSVPVLRAMHRDRATLNVSAVATVGGVAGRTIGTADEAWIIDLLARTPVRQREIEIAEADFRDGPQEWLRPFKDAPWLVETAGEMPTILLNSSFEGITQLLKGSGNPLEKAASGLVAAQIAGEAWTAMFHSAVADLELDDDGAPLIPSGWRESVLRTMLPDVLPGLALADALIEVHNRHAAGYGWAELQSQIHFAASRRAQVPKNLTTAVRAITRSQEGATR
ncbi:hypothetical protein [Actinacidiphila soli]|uniref:hypothetical protein n=1 Tax=Actinacidiphila soli TaxID=2487275 RepID=UPI000FCBB2B8|nr:hypothetical protein [Actinacidiphila soli]